MRAIAAFLSEVLSVHGADPAHVAAAQPIATPPPQPNDDDADAAAADGVDADADSDATASVESDASQSDVGAATATATASLLLDGAFAPLDPDSVENSWATAGAVAILANAGAAVDPADGAIMAASIQSELELQHKLTQIERALNGEIDPAGIQMEETDEQEQ